MSEHGKELTCVHVWLSPLDREMIGHVNGLVHTQASPEQVNTFLVQEIARGLEEAYNRYGSFRQTEREIVARLKAEALNGVESIDRIAIETDAQEKELSTKGYVKIAPNLMARVER